MGNMAIAAPTPGEQHKVVKHHSWHECMKLKITSRDNIGTSKFQLFLPQLPLYRHRPQSTSLAATYLFPPVY